MLLFYEKFLKFEKCFYGNLLRNKFEWVENEWKNYSFYYWLVTLFKFDERWKITSFKKSRNLTSYCL